MLVVDDLKKVVSHWLLKRRFPKSVIYFGAKADTQSHLGDYSVLFRDAMLIQTQLGAYSYVQAESIICNTEIGKFCSIAGDVSIGLAAHPMHMVSTSPVFFDNTQPLPKFFVNERLFADIMPKTVIGADVWIGQGVMIKAGINIGTGAVIGAGSIVTKDIPPYFIAAGNPCRKIRLRFEENIIEQLILSKWWELDDDILLKHTPFFVDIGLFLSGLRIS